MLLAAAPTELSQSIENSPFSPLIGEKHPAVASKATRRSQRSTMILEGPIKSLHQWCCLQRLIISRSEDNSIFNPLFTTLCNKNGKKKEDSLTSLHYTQGQFIITPSHFATIDFFFSPVLVVKSSSCQILYRLSMRDPSGPRSSRWRHSLCRLFGHVCWCKGWICHWKPVQKRAWGY